MAKVQRTKIGIRDVNLMQPQTTIWDATIRGFCARRQFTDIVTYSVFYRTHDGVQRLHKIGRHGVFTPDLARREAARILRSVALGEDPSNDRKEQRNSMTVAQLCDEYQQRDNGKKTATVVADNSRIKMHIKPKLGKMRVATITSEQVEDFMHSLSRGSATRTLGLLGAIFQYALRRKLRPDNPCYGFDKPAQMRRTRRLSENEYKQLGVALKDSPISHIFMLIAVTGWRSSEAKNLRWDEVDLPRQIATLGDTKTGVSVRPLSRIAVQIIEAQPKNSPYVFDHGHGKPIEQLRHQWLKLGMLADVTPHTLRHSLASLAGDMGIADSTISGLLGHSRNSITSRYIHLDKALISAADLVAAETIRLIGA
jgi:integrase